MVVATVPVRRPVITLYHRHINIDLTTGIGMTSGLGLPCREADVIHHVQNILCLAVALVAT